MKNFALHATWDEATKTLKASVELDGCVVELPQKQVTGANLRQAPNVLDVAFDTYLSRTVIAAVEQARGNALSYATAAGVLDKARELLGLPENYGKKWVGIDILTGEHLFVFPDKDTADAWVAESTDLGFDVRVEFTEPNDGTPDWTDPPLPTESTEPATPALKWIGYVGESPNGTPVFWFTDEEAAQVWSANHAPDPSYIAEGEVPNGLLAWVAADDDEDLF